MEKISDLDLKQISGGFGLFFRAIFYIGIFKGFICGTATRRR